MTKTRVYGTFPEGLRLFQSALTDHFGGVLIWAHIIEFTGQQVVLHSRSVHALCVILAEEALGWGTILPLILPKLPAFRRIGKARCFEDIKVKYLNYESNTTLINKNKIEPKIQIFHNLLLSVIELKYNTAELIPIFCRIFF